MQEHQRIELGGVGLGEVSDADIEKRAQQIAHADGRDEVNELDRAEALREIQDPLREGAQPEEEIAESDRLGTGDPPASTGGQAPRFDLDDEANVADREVREGVEEADFDTRVQAADEAET